MKGLITCVFILGLVSPCLCVRWNVVTKNTLYYNVMDYGARGDGKSDDSQAFLSAWNSTCGAEGTATLVIPPRKLFMVTNLILGGGNCKATSIHIQLKGKIVAPSKDAWKDKSYWIRIEYVNNLTIGGRGLIDGYGSTWWQCKSCLRPILKGKIVAPSKDAWKDKSYWIRIEYVNNLTIGGRGLIDGYGSTWWQCKSCLRPIALFFHSCNNLTVSDLGISNPPGAHIAINGCDGATFSNIFINSPAYSPNTDGFDISVSKNIVIQDSTIHAGDDCIAINGGCSNINATRVACGPGHGISIGSLGKDNSHETVEEVYVQNCSFTGSSNGARIKTFPGGSGYARKITFEQIQLINVSNPIIIDQHYGVKDATDSAVQVSDVTYRGFNGTSASDIAINLDCSSFGCFNIVLDQIDIVSARPGKKTHAFCRNAHGTVDSTIPRAALNH